MIEVHVSREVDAPLEKVWALMANFGDLSWAPGIERLEVIGEGIGMIRRVYMPGMEPIDEVLTGMFPEENRLSYDIPRGLPMPMTDYSASGQVSDLGEGRSRLDWYGRCKPLEGLSEADASKILEDTYVMLLGWINDSVTA
ncbi:SRPBCC family protein [Spongiibacter sp. KMU-158]|uniref:SRPBCC family protein n=1 Tax=Spongiibacter pelagi TaxID=2760804 RepID=A0A927GX84_9GAMM|nr:SRPBCC family protein [Spongiibacter pelagi]MBD2859159.1 SRPBCC family protein [Spongiibacter pelagi]